MASASTPSSSSMVLHAYVVGFSTPGFHDECTAQAIAALEACQLLEHTLEVTRLPDPSYLKRSLQEHSPLNLCVWAGGETLKMKDQAQECRESVRTAVDHGWRYLGLCAGGILASKFLISPWRGNAPLFSGATLFELLPLKAIGRLSAAQPLQSAAPPYAIDLQLNLGGILRPSCRTLWWLGPQFEVLTETSSDKEVQILAQYSLPDELRPNQKHPPAIVSGDFGRGRVIASGVHPEYTLPEGESREADRHRQELFDELIKQLFS